MRDQYTLEWFVPYVHCGEVCVELHARHYVTHDLFLKARNGIVQHSRRYITASGARASIEPLMPRATELARVVANQVREIETAHGVSIDYYMAGDTHGVEEDFLSVDFIMDGYHFNFEI